MDRSEARLRALIDANSKEQKLVEISALGQEAEVEDRLIKARDDLLAASLMESNGYFAWAVACAYYAMYHATLAALASVGYRAYTHCVAIEAFETIFTRRGRLPEDLKAKLGRVHQLKHDYVELIWDVKEARERSQYEVYPTTSGDASSCISNATEFVSTVEEHLTPID